MPSKVSTSYFRHAHRGHSLRRRCEVSPTPLAVIAWSNRSFFDSVTTGEAWVLGGIAPIFECSGHSMAIGNPLMPGVYLTEGHSAPVSQSLPLGTADTLMP
jgi:hypothetical protein